MTVRPGPQEVLDVPPLPTGDKQTKGAQLTIQDSVDKVFDSGHEHCSAPAVTLSMCQPCAVLVADMVLVQAHRIGVHDADVEYYLTALSADIKAQVVQQTVNIDAELEGFTS